MRLKLTTKHQEPHLQFKDEIINNPRFNVWKDYFDHELDYVCKWATHPSDWHFLHPDDEDFGGPEEFKTLKLEEMFDYYP